VIPQTALVVSGPFGAALSAEDVARAIARGLHAAGLPEPDLCPIEVGKVAASEIASLLAGLDFDARMRRARAVVLAEELLQESTLRGSIAFEIATRARQGGVPAYAVTGENALSPFDARILDLQVILGATTRRGLVAKGTRLAGLVGWPAKP
jgi:glycerate kinase